ncbi:hypothetical protein CVU37_11245 [candidate division BRC1 bacterium HGW-BRC1-1]|jgi:hypothetical protein|nr:MAG: hypothetical protein CVU37_11245 [candidate division BRC1 bacterium HGW-BRC1-1]
MPQFTGKAMDLSFQRALEDAIRQAMIHKAEEEHGTLTSFEVTRIYAERNAGQGFNVLQVEIEVQ